MGEIAIRVGESVCMAAADARWIGSHLGCYRLDRMEDLGASLLLTCMGVLVAVVMTHRRRPGRDGDASKAREIHYRWNPWSRLTVTSIPFGQRTPEPK